MMAEYLTTTEAAEASGLAEKYIERLARRGRIQAVRKSNRYWIDAESLRAYLLKMETLGTQKFNWRREEEPT